MISVIQTANAPRAIGPYSQGVCAGDLVFVSGQIPADPKTGEIVGGGVSEQAKQVFENIKAVLEAADCTMESVVKATVFLKNMDDFVTVNGIYGTYFNGAVLPARAAVEVSRLPKDILVEVEVVACKG
jgi:2-iminobutanoate/2-iminopropanoate deaminase